ncbi:MAG: peptidylprolyl isomerase [Pseudonocardia sp.]|nr:peptidylprolyl isomerase [Pseudonocardia sp.]
MATNQMRRDAAKRKLASQQARRAQQAARRRRIAVISSAAVVVIVLVAVVALSTIGRGDDAAASAAPSAAAGATSAAKPAAATPGTCAYPSDGSAAKQNTPPPTEGVSSEGTVSVALATSAGPIGLTLNRAEAPCTVNSFVSLAKQGYFDGTGCHRLTTGEGLKVLQCGDPTGTGTGGPGYTIPDEAPTTLAAAPSGQGSVTYPRGTIAMAKTAQPNSGGSQFFLVYADSTLPPEYTVFGTIDATGLKTIDKVAAAGTSDGNGSGDGKPKTPVEIRTATVS